MTSDLGVFPRKLAALSRARAQGRAKVARLARAALGQPSTQQMSASLWQKVRVTEQQGKKGGQREMPSFPAIILVRRES